MRALFLPTVLLLLGTTGLVNDALGQATAVTLPTTFSSAEVYRLPEAIAFDGHVDEAAWASIPPLPLVQQGPTFGADLSQRTELRLAYDEAYVYLSARCYDTEPLTRASYRRDGWDGSNDQIALILDTFNDHENALVFVLYATGARIDAAMANDARQMGDANIDWNTFWDGAVTRDEHGWYAELRVPLSSLRFQKTPDGKVTMGVLAYRFIARNQELQIFPEVPPDWGFWSFVKPSKGERLAFQGLKPTRPLYVTPYAIGGLGQDFRLNDAETAYRRHDNPTYDVGFDLKYSLTSNLTMDLSVNTDFAQVEADNQQVNLTRFSLFFPEKRQFFLERTSTFDFNFGGFDRLFYSRRIGLNGGNQVQLLGGGRLVGRMNGWDVGLLTMQSARDKGLPSENFGVVRLKRQVFNPNSYLGGMATSRIDEDGTYNVAYGLDGVVNVQGDDYLRLNWAQTFAPEGSATPLDVGNSRFRLLWQRARSVGLGFDLGVSRAGVDYAPGLGFQLRQDFTQALGSVGYGWRPEAPSPIGSHRISLDNNLFIRNTDGVLETATTSMQYNLSLRSDHNFNAQATFVHEDLLEGFSLSDKADILAGTYQYVEGELGYNMPGGRRLSAGFGVAGGAFFDGTQAGARISPRWSVSPNLELNATYRYNHIRFASRDQTFNAHLFSLRADVMLNTRLTLTSLMQYNSTADAFIANVRFRFNPREGNDFFLVYNEAFNTDRYAVLPELPMSTSRTVIAKYTYTFIW